ncbi:hypothetical protein DFJ73DRAFT_968186 [Zopfochytrium polystomum]|nr:hypothetical protein DFJ73DRAFT_968186 [Zopfochytrium polystomum]
MSKKSIPQSAIATPLYISLIKLCWSIAHFIDHAMFFTSDGHLARSTCKAMGAFLFVFLTAEGVMTILMALSVFMAIQFGWPLVYGRNDWILLCVTLGMPCLTVIIAFAFDAVGPDLYFCFLDTSRENGIIMAGTIGVIATTCLILPIVLYLFVLRKLKVIGTRSSSKTSAYNRFGDVLADRVQRSVVIKTSRYVAIILITYIPSAMYGLMIGIFRAEPYAAMFIVVTLVNAGGTVNTIAYLYQRRLTRLDEAAQLSDPLTRDGLRPVVATTPTGGSGGSSDNRSIQLSPTHQSPQKLDYIGGGGVYPGVVGGGGAAAGMAGVAGGRYYYGERGGTAFASRPGDGGDRVAVAAAGGAAAPGFSGAGPLSGSPTWSQTFIPTGYGQGYGGGGGGASGVGGVGSGSGRYGSNPGIAGGLGHPQGAMEGGYIPYGRRS